MSSDAERIISLYERHARQWDADRRRGRFIEKDWLERFIAFLPAGGGVLDLGCGASDPIARHLIERGLAITGVDSSPTMIALSCERHPDQDWIVHDMRTLSLGRSFDGVLAWDSFFHLSFDDQRRMFPVFGAHAAPGAPLLFSSGPRHGEAVGSYQGEPLYHASLDPAEYRSLLDTNGFSVVTFVPEDPTCGGHTVWLARRDKAG
jgi:SAM-dependent methyltransferase